MPYVDHGNVIGKLGASSRERNGCTGFGKFKPLVSIWDVEEMKESIIKALQNEQLSVMRLFEQS